MSRAEHTPGVAPTVAWVLVGISVLTGVAGVAFTLALPASDPMDPLVALVQGLLATGYPTIGALVATRQPKNACGWILIAIGLFQGLSSGFFAFGAYLEQVYGAGSLSNTVQWVSNWIWFPSLCLLAIFIPLLFPDGRLPSNRWRPFGRAAVAVLVLGTAMSMYMATVTPPDKDAPTEGFAVLLTPALFGGLLLAGAGAVASLVVRFRRSRGVERQQLKYLAVGGTGAFAGVLMTFSPLTPLWAIPDVLLLLSLPVLIGLAILRYRLYDIDRVISRTVGYIMLTGLLLAVYAAGVFGLRPLVGHVAGQSDAAVAISTIVVAALFGPARRRIQAAVDRRFNRARYDAARVVEQFSAHLREQVDAAALEEDLISVVHRTVAPSQATLWLRSPQRS